MTKREEGFWNDASNHYPQYPFPVPHDGDWKRALFLNKLKQVEFDLCHREAYRGISPCRLCGCFNGHETLSLENWHWPSGFIHYIRDHNVRPSDDFIAFIEEQYLTKVIKK